MWRYFVSSMVGEIKCGMQSIPMEHKNGDSPARKQKTVLGCVMSWDSLGGVRGGAEGFAAEEEPEDDHAGGAGDGGQAEGRGGTAQVQQAAA